MYGADKIPDSWFERVPGGFYREKEKGDREVKKRERRARRKHDKDRGYEDDDDDDSYFSDSYDARRGRHGDYDDHKDHKDHKDQRHGDRSHRKHTRGKSMGYEGARYEEPAFGGVYMETRPYNPAEYAHAGVDGAPRRQRGDGARYAAVR